MTAFRVQTNRSLHLFRIIENTGYIVKKGGCNETEIIR